MSLELRNLRAPQRRRASLHRRNPHWYDDAIKEEWVRYASEQRRTIRDRRIRANMRCLGWLVLLVPTAGAFHDVILRFVGL
jgi:hypothetical protein